MKPSDNLKAAAAAAFIATAGLIAYGVLKPDVAPGKRRTSVAWQKAPTGDVRCIWTSALASEESLNLFGLATDGGGARYVHVRQCAEVGDGGEAPSLPPGMQTIEDSQEEVAYDGGPQTLAVLQGEAEAPCACSPGLDSGCEMRGVDGGWMPARFAGADGGWRAWNNTLPAGEWRGGCFPKVCIEAADVTSWSSECAP